MKLFYAGTRYKFRVSAENRHGMSQESQAVTTRMMEEGRDLYYWYSIYSNFRMPIILMQNIIVVQVLLRRLFIYSLFDPSHNKNGKSYRA